MGGREVTRRYNCFFLQENEWSRSYREINQHPSLPWNSITHGFLDPSAFSEMFVLRLPSEKLPSFPGTEPRECPKECFVAFFLAQKGQKALKKHSLGERQSIAQKGVRAFDARNSWLENGSKMLQKPVFALPGCQRTSVNTLVCDTLGLADSLEHSEAGTQNHSKSTPQSTFRPGPPRTPVNGGRDRKPRKLGACVMTTKFLDNKIFTFKILLS